MTELAGYARVSTREERQVFDRQADALKAAGCERVFEDRGSGASTERAGLRNVWATSAAATCWSCSTSTASVAWPAS